MCWVEVWEAAIGVFLGSFVGVLGALLVFWPGVRHSRRQERARLEWEHMSTLKLLLEDLLQHKNALEIKLTRMQQQNEHLIEEITNTLLTGVEGQDHLPRWRRVFGG